MAELKPCPFCGGKPFVQEVKDVIKNPWYSVKCYCGVMLHYKSRRDEVVEAWNRRAEDGK